MNQTLLRLALLPGLVLFSCGGRDAVDEDLRLDVNGTSRRYLLHVPAGLDSGGPHPAVLVLHGGGGRGKAVETIGRYTGMSDKADEAGFIAVYPAALVENWNDGRNAPALREQADNVDDVGFIRALMDSLVADRHVDPRRVYATGISNGGFMSHRLGCELADRLVAIAPVAAGMAEPLSPNCRPTRPVPVLYFHGTADGYVPFDGGNVTVPVTGQNRGPTLSSNDTRARWAAVNGCSPEVDRRTQNDRRDGTSLQWVEHRGCPPGVQVVQGVVESGGHTWPGARWVPMLGRVTREVDASDAIWDFFRERSLP